MQEAGRHFETNHNASERSASGLARDAANLYTSLTIQLYKMEEGGQAAALEPLRTYEAYFADKDARNPDGPAHEYTELERATAIRFNELVHEVNELLPKVAPDSAELHQAIELVEKMDALVKGRELKKAA